MRRPSFDSMLNLVDRDHAARWPEHRALIVRYNIYDYTHNMPAKENRPLVSAMRVPMEELPHAMLSVVGNMNVKIALFIADDNDIGTDSMIGAMFELGVLPTDGLAGFAVAVPSSIAAWNLGLLDGLDGETGASCASIGNATVYLAYDERTHAGSHALLDPARIGCKTEVGEDEIGQYMQTYFVIDDAHALPKIDFIKQKRAVAFLSSLATSVLPAYDLYPKKSSESGAFVIAPDAAAEIYSLIWMGKRELSFDGVALDEAMRLCRVEMSMDARNSSNWEAVHTTDAYWYMVTSDGGELASYLEQSDERDNRLFDELGDAIAIWGKAASRAGLDMADGWGGNGSALLVLPDNYGVMTAELDEALRSLRDAGEAIGVPSMLDAYLGGVPLDDI